MTTNRIHGVLIGSRMTTIALHDDGTLDYSLKFVNGPLVVREQRVTPEAARARMLAEDFPVLVKDPAEAYRG